MARLFLIQALLKGSKVQLSSRKVGRAQRTEGSQGTWWGGGLLCGLARAPGCWEVVLGNGEEKFQKAGFGVSEGAVWVRTRGARDPTLRLHFMVVG